MGHTPAGAATRQMVHYAQNKNHEKHFRQYDFLLGNLAKYGQLTPPDYKLDKITAPVSLFVSGNDWFSNLSDVEKLKELLPNLVYEYHVIPKTDTEFNHLDYLYAIHAPECVYAQYLDLLSQYP